MVMHHGIHYYKILATVTWLGAVQAAEQVRLISTTTSNTTKSVSDTVSAAVSFNQPTYVLPTIQSVQLLPRSRRSVGDDLADEIYVLPDIKVTTAKPPPVPNFAFLNLKGRLELALKSNPGLRLGPLPRLNYSVALEMQKEEREDSKRFALTERVLSIAVGEKAKAKELIRLMRAATARPNTDWQTNSPGKK